MSVRARKVLKAFEPSDAHRRVARDEGSITAARANGGVRSEPLCPAPAIQNPATQDSLANSGEIWDDTAGGIDVLVSG
jgi:hypothetical protein